MCSCNNEDTIHSSTPFREWLLIWNDTIGDSVDIDSVKYPFNEGRSPGYNSQTKLEASLQ